MPSRNAFVFRPVTLKPGLLKTPYGIQTHWHVITGAPSSGKTTLINQLAARGFQVAPEGARLYMEGEMAKGHTLEEMRSDMHALQRVFVNVQVEIESRLPVSACIFLDRALPDCLAWYRVFGVDPNEFLRECFRYRYASVSILDPLPVRLNGLRFQEGNLPTFLHEWHIKDYRALGYQITHVPALPPEARLAFVLQALSGQAVLEIETAQ